MELPAKVEGAAVVVVVGAAEPVAADSADHRHYPERRHCRCYHCKDYRCPWRTGRRADLPLYRCRDRRPDRYPAAVPGPLAALYPLAVPGPKTALSRAAGRH